MPLLTDFTFDRSDSNNHEINPAFIGDAQAVRALGNEPPADNSVPAEIVASLTDLLEEMQSTTAVERSCNEHPRSAYRILKE